MTRTARSSATRRERHGVIGPFSGRQLRLRVRASSSSRSSWSESRRRSGPPPTGPAPVDPRATAYILSSPPPVGLKVGATAPEFAVANDDGSTYQLDRPRRQPDQPRRPQGQGRLGQLLDDLVPALPVRDPDPARPRRRATRTAASRSSRSASRRPRRRTSRRMRPIPAAVHDRLRRRRARSSTPTRRTGCRPSSSSMRTGSSRSSTAVGAPARLRHARRRDRPDRERLPPLD